MYRLEENGVREERKREGEEKIRGVKRNGKKNMGKKDEKVEKAQDKI